MNAKTGFSLAAPLGAFVLLVAALAWVGRGEMRLAEFRAHQQQRRGIGVDALPESVQTLAADEGRHFVATWGTPKRPGHGEAWDFDLFTPPVVYFDPASGRYSVTPPQTKSGHEADAIAAMAAPFGVRVLAVERVPFRLQLVGYAGGDGNHFGIFENQVTGETLLIRKEQALSDLGLVVRAVAVKTEHIAEPDSMPLRETVATAEIWDERAQRRVRLSSREVLWDDALWSRMQADDTQEVRTLGVGGRWSHESGDFEVISISAEPAVVTVRKRHADGSHETLSLHPAASQPMAAPRSASL